MGQQQPSGREPLQRSPPLAQGALAAPLQLPPQQIGVPMQAPPAALPCRPCGCRRLCSSRRTAPCSSRAARSRRPPCCACRRRSSPRPPVWNRCHGRAWRGRSRGCSATPPSGPLARQASWSQRQSLVRPARRARGMAANARPARHECAPSSAGRRGCRRRGPRPVCPRWGGPPRTAPPPRRVRGPVLATAARRRSRHTLSYSSSEAGNMAAAVGSFGSWRRSRRRGARRAGGIGGNDPVAREPTTSFRVGGASPRGGTENGEPWSGLEGLSKPWS